jgi:hypothetical protein
MKYYDIQIKQNGKIETCDNLMYLKARKKELRAMKIKFKVAERIEKD